MKAQINTTYEPQCYAVIHRAIGWSGQSVCYHE